MPRQKPMGIRFPPRSTPGELQARLARALAEVRPFHDKFAFAVTPPAADVVDVISLFQNKNSNNIGFRDATPTRGTRQLEAEVIRAVSRLMEDPEAAGWLTSGGTEGNLTGLWMGREYLRSHGARNPLLVTTELRHESIDRAARILDFKHQLHLPLDSAARIFVVGVAAEVEKAFRRNGNDSLLLALTIGTTQAGTCDPVDEVHSALAGIQNPTYVHVDASLGGLLVPFVNPRRPVGFSNHCVNSVIVDPHKLGGVPIGAGIFLCRAGLTKYTETPSRISPVVNSTLSGSRSGAMAAGVWYSLFSKGHQGLTRTARHCLKMKEAFLSDLSQRDTDICVIADPDTNVVAIGLTHRLPVEVEVAYRLKPWQLRTSTEGKLQNYLFYTIKFMPHATRKAVDRLTKEILGRGRE